MNTKETTAILKRFLPDLPGFAVKERLLFIQPLGHVLRGAFFDRSSSRWGLSARIFVQPLCSRSDRLWFEVGWMLTGGLATFKTDAPDYMSNVLAGLKREALPYWTKSETPQGAAEAVTALGLTGVLFYWAVIGYLWARAGDVQRALPALERTLDFLGDTPIWVWERDMKQRTELLHDLLVADAAGAQRQLDIWEKQTIQNLGLEQFV
jgi:hypothetical protein